MTFAELTEKRNKLMNDATALARTKDITKEQRAQVKLMLADVDDLEEQRNVAQRIEAFEAEQRAVTRPPRGQLNQNPTSDDEQRSAFTEYIRKGTVRSGLAMGETRDITSGSGGGGALIPQALYGSIVSAQKAWGQLPAILKNFPSDFGGPLKIPINDDRANSLVVVGEPASTTEADPTLSSINSNTDLCSTNWVKVSLPLLNNSSFDIQAFVSELFGQRYWRGITQLVSGGSSTGNIQSIYSTATVAATSASPTAVTYQDLISLFSGLENSYENTSSFLMSSTVRNSLMGVTDTLGRPLFIPSANDGGLDRLLGRPIVINNYAPALAAGNKAILFGDFAAGYMLRVPTNMSIYRTTDKFIDTAEIGFIGFAEVGGVSIDPGSHPIMALQQHA